MGKTSEHAGIYADDDDSHLHLGADSALEVKRRLPVIPQISAVLREGVFNLL